MSASISRTIAGRSRRNFVSHLVKGMIQSDRILVAEIAQPLREKGEYLEAVWLRIRHTVASGHSEKLGEEWRAA